VIEPCSTGIGGDCFALYFDAASGRVHGLNGSGRAPAALSLQHILNELGDQHVPRTVPMTSVHAITVPGAVAGWVDAVSAWGKLDMHRVLAPAIQLAERG
jgi:gamma-glutamyltranspeptidase/glutathione hydrolase